MTRPWYDDPDRIERMREQDIELHLLDCPAWRRIEAEYRNAYDTPDAELVQPVRVLLWADGMIQRALRLGKNLRTDLPASNQDTDLPASNPHQTSVTDLEQRALDNIPESDQEEEP